MMPRTQKEVTVPYGVFDKAQDALKMLKEVVIELAKANKQRVTNAEVSKSLGLQSDYRGRQKNYLSYSILGLLMSEGRMKRGADKRHQAQVG